MIYDVCVDSVEGVLAAEQGGAPRVELCADLVEGGVTPSLGMMRVVRQQVKLAVNVLLRPRGGDFLYTELEYEVMRQDIQAAKEAGMDGVVIGLLLPDGRVDAERTRALVELSRPLSVTFHRAIDLCRDAEEALDTLIELGVDRVLTSGLRPSAAEGAECIARLVRRAEGRVPVMAGGGVSADNLTGLLAETGVSEVHFSARVELGSAMQFRNPGCFMGKAYQPDEYSRRVTDAERVRQVIAAGGYNRGPA